jgi:hypothetical protein
LTFVTHAATINGRIHGELKNPGLSPEEEIRRQLLRLDGVRLYSLILWAIPPGVPFDRVDLRKWPQEYIQAAGSRDRLMVEVRRILDGRPQQRVVGHQTSPDAADSGAGEIIHWNGCETAVLPGEVFEAGEAGDLFVGYYQTAGIPPQYTLRVLQL